MGKEIEIAKSELSDLLDKARGERIDICAKVYELICEVDNKNQFLRYFLEYDLKDSSDEYEIEMKFTASQIQKLVLSCKTLVSGILEKLFVQNLDEEIFYCQLWDFISNESNFTNDDERICALYLVWANVRIPYFKLDDGLKMSNEDYAEYVKKLTPQIKKAIYISNSRFEQKTEAASLLIALLDELSNKEEKAIILTQVISMIEQRVIKQILGDLGNKKTPQ